MSNKYTINRPLLSVIAVVFMLSGFTWADQSVQDVNWRISGGGKIKQIRYFTKPDTTATTDSLIKAAPPAAGMAVTSNVIDSPPVDGFVPWIAIAVTDARGEDFEPSAVPHLSVTGNPLTSTPSESFAVGIFDTGASAHVLSYATGIATGIYANADDTFNPQYGRNPRGQRLGFYLGQSAAGDLYKRPGRN